MKPVHSGKETTEKGQVGKKEQLKNVNTEKEEYGKMTILKGKNLKRANLKKDYSGTDLDVQPGPVNLVWSTRSGQPGPV